MVVNGHALCETGPMGTVYHMTPADTFRRLLAPLRQAFDDACARPRERWTTANAEHARLGADIENFGGETNEDRRARDDREYDLERDMDAAESTLGLIRHAFTISLFHFWERWVVNEMGVATVSDEALSDAQRRARIEKILDYRHDPVVGFLRRHGLAPDPRRLRILQLAANVAKHASGKGNDVELFGLRPDLFEARYWKYGDYTTYQLRIHDAFLDEMFEAVMASGPQQD